MKRTVVMLSLAFFAATSALLGQSPSAPKNQSAPTVNKAQAAKDAKAAKKAEVHIKPFSAFAFEIGRAHV